jgi:EmrB/QacA subfamily drug resistance transporter
MPSEPTDRRVDDSDRQADVSVDLTVEAPGADEVAVVPWPLLWRDRLQRRATASDRYPWVVLVASLFGLLSVGFLITVLSVSIPEIADDLGTQKDVLTWVITGPILAFAVIGPAAGKVGDLYGSRRIYLISLVGVGVFAVLTAIAWDAGSLIAFRVLGAAVGAAVGPSSISMINKMFPPHRRALALGYWSFVAAGGPMLGVIVGGPAVEAFGWRLIFVAQIPLTILALVVGFLVLPETERRRDVRFDLAGSTLLALGVGALLVALNRGPILGWSHVVVVVGFALCPTFIAAFVWVERRIDHPLIPLRYFGRANFAFPIANQFFANFAYMGGFIISPLFVEAVLGYGPARTGFLMAPRPLAFAITGPIAGYVTMRIGERTNAVIGASLIVASMLGLAAVGEQTSDLFIVGALVLSGIGMGTCAPAMAAAVANSVDERDLGVVAAAQQMMAQVGVVAGIQILQTVQAAREPIDGVAGSYHAAFYVGALAAGLGVVAALFVRSTRRGLRRSEPERRRGTLEGAPSDEVFQPARS